MINQPGMTTTADERSPLHHTQKIKLSLQEIADHLREDVGKIDDPRAKAMFETSAEVIDGIITAFTHYEQKGEQAWKM
jgi:hypothetical protein